MTFIIYHNGSSVTTACVSPVRQKKGPKRRPKSRRMGSMGVASERAISIPQITYDHIDDSVEKKDVSLFLEEQKGTAEGNSSQISVTCKHS